MTAEEIQNLVNKVTDMVNVYGDENQKTFVRQMSFQHRTLQQSFTQLCFMWIKFAGSDEYRFDGRNQATHEECKKIKEALGDLKLPCI